MCTGPEPVAASAVSIRMTKPKSPPDKLITDPLTPKPVKGDVVVKDPPEAAMTLTPHAAEVSGLRMLDAADNARNDPRRKR